MHTSAKC